MQLDSVTTARIASLKKELHCIHTTNMLHWRQGENQTRAARAEYHRRQDRIEEIRAEIAGLRFEEILNELFLRQSTP